MFSSQLIKLADKCHNVVLSFFTITYSDSDSLIPILYFNFSVPLTVASIFMSLLNFTITAWNLQAKDHIAKDELNHSSANEDNNPVKHFHQNVTSVFTHVVWTLSSIVVYSGSLVFLLLLAYIEMFSNYLMDTGFKVNIHLLPFFIILSNIPVNIILYKIFINNKDSFSLAHAILSPIKPCRYEIIPDNM